jgi:hypothetical protein
MTDIGKEFSIDSLKEKRSEINELTSGIYAEVEATAKKVGEKPTQQEMRKHLDRWEEIRSQLSNHLRLTLRGLADFQDAYSDGMRKSILSSRGGSGSHYKEREAEYETRNLDTFVVVRTLEKIEVELRESIKFINNRIFWLDQYRREVSNTLIPNSSDYSVDTT